MTSTSGDPQRILYGIGLAVAGYACFSIQDAIIKWLVPHYAVFEILFVRSVLIIIIMAVVTRGAAMIDLVRSRNKPALLARGVLVLLAWSCYYTAARSLGLAELVTLYFAAPLFVVILSTVILKEKVTGARWIAVLVGLDQHPRAHPRPYRKDNDTGDGGEHHLRRAMRVVHAVALDHADAV